MSAVSIGRAPTRTGRLRPSALWLAVPGLVFLAVFFVWPVAQLWV